MESQFAGQRAQSLHSSKSDSSKSTTVNSTKPIFNISGSSKGVESSTTAAVESKKEVPQVNVSFTSNSEEQSKCKAVKAVLYKVVRVYESRPANTMKYLGIVCILLLFVGVMSIALAQEATEDKTQSKYGMAFTLGEAAASSASSEKFVAPPAPESAAAIIDGNNATSTEEPVVTTFAPKVDEVKSDVDNGNSTSEEKGDNQNDESNFNNRPSMVIDNEDDEKTEDDPNPRIVFIERLMGLHLSAPANKGDGQGEQKDNGNEQAPNPIRNDKVNAKWAARTRKFTIPIPNQGEPQGMMPPQAVQEHPMLRFAAAAMMSRLIAAAARAQMEAQAREAIQARSKDDESEENSIPMILAAVRDGQSVSRLPIQPHPQMYGQPKMMRPPFAYQQQQQQQQPRQLPSMVHPSFISPMQQRPNIVIQRRIAPISQPVVVMLAVPSQQQSVYSHRPQMPYYPSVPYSVPVIYRQQMPAASMAMPIQIQRPAYVQSYAQPRHVLAVPVDHMHYPGQHQVIAIRPQMVESAVHASHDHQASPSEHNHMVFVYDAEVQHDDADDLEPSASEDREEPYHNKAKLNHYIERHLPVNPTPNKIKLWREMMNAKHAAQTGVRYIPVSVASSEEQSQPPINHFLPQKRFAFQKPQESSMRPTFVLLANHQSEN